MIGDVVSQLFKPEVKRFSLFLAWYYDIHGSFIYIEVCSLVFCVILVYLYISVLCPALFVIVLSIFFPAKFLQMQINLKL